MTTPLEPTRSSSGALVFQVDLPLVPRAAALARRTVDGVLRSWHVTDEDWTYEVLLLSSELVGNAVRHGGRRVSLGLTLDRSRLRIEVRDGSLVVPAPREDADESGRGLAIVEALAEEWGVIAHADGKTVWAGVALPAAALPRQRGADEGGADAHGVAS